MMMQSTLHYHSTACLFRKKVQRYACLAQIWDQGTRQSKIVLCKSSIGGTSFHDPFASHYSTVDKSIRRNGSLSRNHYRYRTNSLSIPSCNQDLRCEVVNRGNANPYRLSQRRTQVFVSKHNDLKLNLQDIKNFCVGHGIAEEDIRSTNSHVIIKECPFCHSTKGQSDNMYKLYIMVGPGAYFCHRCGAKGSWYDFKMKLGGFSVHGTSSNEGMYDTSSNNNSQSAYRYQRDPSLKINRTTKSRKLPSDFCSPMPNPRLNAVYISNLTSNKSLLPAPDTDSHKDNASTYNDSAAGTQRQHNMKALEYLTTERGLNMNTLLKYGVGSAVYQFRENGHNSHGFVPSECVTFPFIMRASEVKEQELLKGNTYNWEREQKSEEETIKEKGCDSLKDANLATTLGPWVTRRIKARSLQKKSWQRLDPPGGGWGFFGWHTIPNDATEIIITEGEYDAMAVYQVTGRPAISVPNGCRSFPVELLPMLEKFDTIYLWMDNDGPGQEGAETFARKLGLGRVLIVNPSNSISDSIVPKDANEALLMGVDIEKLLQSASVLPHERILNFADLRSQVLHEIYNPDKYVGVPVSSLPQFTNVIKGFRRGELTVITGPTGSGKTTFLGQISLDFAEQGVNTLWGSFEIKNTRLMHKLLQQYSYQPLPAPGDPDMKEKVEALADSFEQLPLYFMKFHGGSDVDDVLDAMDYAVYVHDVEHIILDNMQFMLVRAFQPNNGGYRGSYNDKFDMQDLATDKFRKFATERNVHVTLVVHPRKEDEYSRLGLSSIYGSAKSTQEADTVLILQNDGKRKYMDVKKNRFDGTLGSTPLFFHHQSGRYTETMEKPLEANHPNSENGGQNKTEEKVATKKKAEISGDIIAKIDQGYKTLDPGPHDY